MVSRQRKLNDAEKIAYIQKPWDAVEKRHFHHCFDNSGMIRSYIGKGEYSVCLRHNVDWNPSQGDVDIPSLGYEVKQFLKPSDLIPLGRHSYLIANELLQDFYFRKESEFTKEQRKNFFSFIQKPDKTLSKELPKFLSQQEIDEFHSFLNIETILHSEIKCLVLVNETGPIYVPREDCNDTFYVYSIGREKLKLKMNKGFLAP